MRRGLALSLASAFALALGGCFHPLYGPIGVDGSRTVVGELQAIAVAPVPDRIGHYVENDLIFALNGTGDRPAPRYRLTVTTKERVESAIIDTLEQRATAGTLVVEAPFHLIDTQTEHELYAGSVVESADYDRSDQRFANVRAARDAEIRVAQVLADQIRTRVAAYFATRS